MSYSDLPAKASGDILGLAEYNIIRDNFDVGAPDVVAAKGDLLVGTGPDAMARLAVGPNRALVIADSTQTVGQRWQVPYISKVYNSAAIDPAVGSWVSLSWDAESFDPDSMHSTVTNPSRLTVPANGAGVYRIEANIGFGTTSLTPGTSGHYGVRILKNGATVNATVFDEAEMQSHDLWHIVASLADMSVGDYLECQVWTGENVDIITTSTFSMQWIGAVS